MRAPSAFALFALAFVAPPSAVAQGDSRESTIVLRVTHPRNTSGRVACGLFTRDNWLGEGRRGHFAAFRGRYAYCVFRDVPPGVYAVSAYHDENGNGTLDKGFLGIPSEGWCTSRNARGSMGPPRFEDAHFVHHGGLRRLSARLRY